MSQLQAQLQTPICLDECIRSAHQAEQAIRMKACRHHQYQAGPRGRIPRSQARARRRPAARHSGVVRGDARIGNRPRAQYRAVDAAEFRAARRCIGEQAILGARHHRAGGGSVRRGAPSQFQPCPASATKSITISCRASRCGRKRSRESVPRGTRSITVAPQFRFRGATVMERVPPRRGGTRRQ